MVCFLIILEVLFLLAMIGTEGKPEAKRYTLCFLVSLILTVIVYLNGGV